MITTTQTTAPATGSSGTTIPPAEEQPTKRKWAGKAAGALVLALLIPVGVHVWHTTVAQAVCSGSITSQVPGMCIRVDSKAAEDYAHRLVGDVDGGDDIADVVQADLIQAPGHSAEGDTKTMEKFFGRTDHASIIGKVTRVGQTDSFQIRVEVFDMIKDPAVSWDVKNWTAHVNKHDEYLLTIHLVQLDPEDGTSVKSTLPNYVRKHTGGLAPAPRFTFLTNAPYYSRANKMTKATKIHHFTKDGFGSAICVWAPKTAKVGDKPAGAVEDWSRAAIRTYAGWVRASDVLIEAPGLVENCRTTH